MEITGKIIKILEPQKGKSSKGEWKNQNFIIETFEKFPKKVCLTCWNNKVDISKIKTGTIIKANIQLFSREFNHKWFTDAAVWKLEIEENQNEAEHSKSDDMNNNSTSFDELEDDVLDIMPF